MDAAQDRSGKPADKSLRMNQFLTCVLDEELFALDIGSVREILEMTSVTKIPRMPDYMRGVINLRGHAVPVIDLRRKFGMGPTPQTVNTCIIIVEVDVGGETAHLGALADSVQEVYEMEPDQIDQPPRMGTAINVEYIRGMGKRDERFIMILDIDKVFSERELAEVNRAMSGAGGAPAEDA